MSIRKIHDSVRNKKEGKDVSRRDDLGGGGGQLSHSGRDIQNKSLNTLNPQSSYFTFIYVVVSVRALRDGVPVSQKCYGMQ